MAVVAIPPRKKKRTTSRQARADRRAYYYKKRLHSMVAYILGAAACAILMAAGLVTGLKVVTGIGYFGFLYCSVASVVCYARWHRSRAYPHSQRIVLPEWGLP